MFIRQDWNFEHGDGFILVVIQETTSKTISSTRTGSFLFSFTSVPVPPPRFAAWVLRQLVLLLVFSIADGFSVAL